LLLLVVSAAAGCSEPSLELLAAARQAAGCCSPGRRGEQRGEGERNGCHQQVVAIFAGKNGEES